MNIYSGAICVSYLCNLDMSCIVLCFIYHGFVVSMEYSLDYIMTLKGYACEDIPCHVSFRRAAQGSIVS